MKSALEAIQYWFMEYGTTENIRILGMAIIVVLLVIGIYKMLTSLHSAMVVYVLAIMAFGTFVYWVHNRNEPEFMTPIVETVAQFLPQKDKIREAFKMPE